MNDITPIQHRSRPVRRPRRYIGRALVAGLVAAAAALPALTATVEPTRAEAPLETPGANTTSFNRAEGRIGATVINNTEGDRTTFKTTTATSASCVDSRATTRATRTSRRSSTPAALRFSRG